MHNVAYTTADGKLVVTIDITDTAMRNAPLSSTGKTKLVGTTSGSIRLSDQLSFSVNVMAKS